MGEIRVRDGVDGFTILEAGLVVNQDEAIAFKAVAFDQRRAVREQALYDDLVLLRC